MKNLIVIGNGMVGHHFIEKAIEKNLHQIYQIHVFSAEKRPAYDRVYLSSYFEHRDASQLNLVDLAHYKQAGITLHLGEAVNHIDAQSKIVTTIKGNALEFDKLVLATGSYPFVPPVKGNQHAHCHVYRTIEDLDAILATADNPRVQRGVVVGGGLLGLEAAKALVTLGLTTYVVEFAPQLMGVQLDAAGVNY